MHLGEDLPVPSAGLVHPDPSTFAGAAGRLYWGAALLAALHTRLQPSQTLFCGIRRGPGAGI